MEKNNKRLQDTYAAITANEVPYEEFMTNDAEYLISRLRMHIAHLPQEPSRTREQGIQSRHAASVTLALPPRQDIAGLAGNA